MNRRIVIIAFIFMLAASFTAFGQDYSQVKASFDAFIKDFSMTLPALTTQGLNWSDAYIGGFPHFGAGATLGVAFVPWDSVEAAATDLGVDLSSIPEFVRNAGFPIPVWCLDGRLGGFGFPFDLGFKIGFLPPDLQLPAGITFDYLLVGADFRWGIIEDLGPIPDISVGLGLNYLGGSATIQDVIASTTITDILVAGDDITMTGGDFFFDWQAMTVDLKAQVSKNLVFVTVTAGFGATYSLYAKAGTGIVSEVLYNTVPISQTDINAIKAAYPELDITGSSFTISGAANGWSLRVFGGLQFDILVFKLDINATYNLLTSAYGGSLNLRAQF